MREEISARIRLRARDVMTPNVITVRPDTAVKDVAAVLLTHHISGLPVVTDGELVGIVTEGDLLYKEIGPHRKDPTFWKGLSPFRRTLETMRKVEGVTAAEVMSSPVITVEEDVPLHEVVGLMIRHKINRVPVMRGSRLVGIVSRADILRAFVRPDAEIAEAVHDALLHELWVDVSRLKIDVKQGVVYLDGEVDGRPEKWLVERWVAAIDGVVQLRSTLTFGFDDREVLAER